MNDKSNGSTLSPLAQRFLAWRKLNGLTQAQVAATLGCRTATVKNWERGRRAPRGLAAAAIEQLLANNGGRAAAVERVKALLDKLAANEQSDA